MNDSTQHGLNFRLVSRTVQATALSLTVCILATGCVSALWQPVKPWYKQAPANSLYPINENYDAIGTDIVDPSESTSQTLNARQPIQSESSGTVEANVQNTRGLTPARAEAAEERLATGVRTSYRTAEARNVETESNSFDAAGFSNGIASGSGSR